MKVGWERTAGGGSVRMPVLPFPSSPPRDRSDCVRRGVYRAGDRARGTGQGPSSPNPMVAPSSSPREHRRRGVPTRARPAACRGRGAQPGRRPRARRDPVQVARALQPSAARRRARRRSSGRGGTGCAATTDPNPVVDGRGLRMLATAGSRCGTGSWPRSPNGERAFAKHMRTGCRSSSGRRRPRSTARSRLATARPAGSRVRPPAPTSRLARGRTRSWSAPEPRSRTIGAHRSGSRVPREAADPRPGRRARPGRVDGGPVRPPGPTLVATTELAPSSPRGVACGRR